MVTLIPSCQCLGGVVTTCNIVRSVTKWEKLCYTGANAQLPSLFKGFSPPNVNEQVGIVVKNKRSRCFFVCLLDLDYRDSAIGRCLVRCPCINYEHISHCMTWSEDFLWCITLVQFKVERTVLRRVFPAL